MYPLSSNVLDRCQLRGTRYYAIDRECTELFLDNLQSWAWYAADFPSSTDFHRDESQILIAPDKGNLAIKWGPWKKMAECGYMRFRTCDNVLLWNGRKFGHSLHSWIEFSLPSVEKFCWQSFREILRQLISDAKSSSIFFLLSIDLFSQLFY